jgi:hypothetical protein
VRYSRPTMFSQRSPKCCGSIPLSGITYSPCTTASHRSGASPGEEHVGEPLRHMVDRLAGQPAFVLGWRWDILGGNRAAEVVIGPYAALDGSRPNVLDLLFSDPARRLFADWQNVARGALSTFRADCAQHIGDPDFEAMVARLPQSRVRGVVAAV